MAARRQYWNLAKPYVGVVFVHLIFAGLSLLGENALNHGLNNYSFVVYRHIFASIVVAPFALVLERKVRPKMTVAIFVKILLLALLEPVLDQLLYFSGMKLTSAIFVTAISNLVPALTFIMAWIFKLEKVNLKSLRCQAKIAGTLVAVGRAMVMTFVRGPIIPTPWNNHSLNKSTDASATKVPIKGILMIAISIICGASYAVLQTITLQSYPAELSMTALMCALGSVMGFAIALVMERGNTSIWSIHFDSKLLFILYAGVVCSGFGYYLQAVIMKTKGPVFLTAFSPLNMVIVTIFGSFFLSEILSLGSLIGAIVIVLGLYLVVWGKIKDPHMQDSAKLDTSYEPAVIPSVHECPKVLPSTTADQGPNGEKNLVGTNYQHEHDQDC